MFFVRVFIHDKKALAHFLFDFLSIYGYVGPAFKMLILLLKY